MFNEITKSKAYDNYSLFSLEKIVKNLQKYLKSKEISIDIVNNSLSNEKTGEYFKFNEKRAIYSKDDKSIIYDLKTHSISGDKDFIIDTKKKKLSTYQKLEFSNKMTAVTNVQFTLEENIEYLIDYISFCKKLFSHKNNSNALLDNMKDWKQIYESSNLKNFNLRQAINIITFVNSVNSLDSKDFINNMMKNIKPIIINTDINNLLSNNKKYKVFLNLSENLSVFLFNKRLYLEISAANNGKNYSSLWSLSDFDLKLKENKKIKDSIESYIEKIKSLEPLIYEISLLVNKIQPDSESFSLNKETLDLYMLEEDLVFSNIESFFNDNKKMLKNKI